MGLPRFFDPDTDSSERRKPVRVYAHVDEVELTEGDDGIVLLDCIEADYVERQGPDAPPFAERAPGRGRRDWPLPDNELSIAEIHTDVIRRLHRDVSVGDWLHIEFAEEERDFVLEQSLTLFALPVTRDIERIVPVDPTTTEVLDRLAGWGDVVHAGPGEIEREIDRTDVDALAIYDVGQGAATAFLKGGRPVVYFDLGGSVIGNVRSFPQHLNRFGFCENAPIVLSHWDWDHWSSACRDRRALKQTWIVPDQSASGALGPTHATFLAMLYASARRVLWWPPGLGSLSLPGLRSILFKAGGSPRDRNNSGLAFFRRSTKDRKSRSVLLPGDASFDSLRRAVSIPEPIDHIMAPHHGGRVRPSRIPAARTKSRSHVVYSYGVGNIFHHPLPTIVKEFRKTWEKNLHTALRNESGFGHIGICLIGSNSPKRNAPCRGYCKLKVQTWI
jgi:beta-lactamase superfamily II metal-dependent hydrolase